MASPSTIDQWFLNVSDKLEMNSETCTHGLMESGDVGLTPLPNLQLEAPTAIII